MRRLFPRESGKVGEQDCGLGRKFENFQASSKGKTARMPSIGGAGSAFDRPGVFRRVWTSAHAHTHWTIFGEISRQIPAHSRRNEFPKKYIYIFQQLVNKMFQLKCFQPPLEKVPSGGMKIEQDSTTTTGCGWVGVGQADGKPFKVFNNMKMPTLLQQSKLPIHIFN